MGKRSIEVPSSQERQRDPRVAFNAQVPVGSPAKSEALATTGYGKAIQCGFRRGADRKSLADIPRIAGCKASMRNAAALGDQARDVVERWRYGVGGLASELRGNAQSRRLSRISGPKSHGSWRVLARRVDHAIFMLLPCCR